MAESKLLVKTTLGTTILDLESRVNVHLNRDLYLEKQAIDLNAGDSVIYKKEFIETTLDEVEKLLDLSPRYMHAKMQVMERNSKNEFVPVLRTELWRGILGKKGSYNTSLEAIVKKEKEDFCSSDYDEAVEMIGNAVNEDKIEISESSMGNWLRGEIYAPRNWNIFNSLAKINPIFKEFDESNQSIDGKYYNYKLFVIARQSVMRYLARLRGEEFKEAEQEKEDRQSRLNIKLNEEIDIVVKGLMEEKGRDYALAKVVSIEMLHPKHPLNKEIRRRPEHRLSKGVESRKVDLEIKSKGINEFLQDFFFVNDLFSTSLNIYIASAYPKEFEPFVMKNNAVKGYQDGVKHLFLQKYSLPDTYKSTHSFKRLKGLLEYDSERVGYAERVTDILINDLFKGKFDEKFLLPPDSYKKLLEAEYKLRTARPRIFTEQEIALDNYEDCLRQLNKIISDSKKRGFMSEEDNLEYTRLNREAREAHDGLMRVEKRIEDRFPLKCTKVYHGGILLAFLENSHKEKKEEDIERRIEEYDLENFREVIKFRYAHLHPEIMEEYGNGDVGNEGNI